MIRFVQLRKSSSSYNKHTLTIHCQLFPTKTKYRPIHAHLTKSSQRQFIRGTPQFINHHSNFSEFKGLACFYQRQTSIISAGRFCDFPSIFWNLRISTIYTAAKGFKRSPLIVRVVKPATTRRRQWPRFHIYCCVRRGTTALSSHTMPPFVSNHITFIMIKMKKV